MLSPEPANPAWGWQTAPLEWLSLSSGPTQHLAAPLTTSCSLTAFACSSQARQRCRGGGRPGPRGSRAAAASEGGGPACPARPHRLVQHTPDGTICFSKLKCIRDTLNPGLSPISHIPVPTWPVKTLALCREIYGYEAK